MPMYIMIPIVAARWTGGARPLQLAFSVYPLRLATGPLTAILAFYTPASVSPIPWIFYTLLVFVIAAAATTSELMFVSQMAFFAHVSDPALGGTYMTLLNTMGNLGGRWPPTAAFFLVDVLSCESESCWMKMDGFYTVDVSTKPSESEPQNKRAARRGSAPRQRSAALYAARVLFGRGLGWESRISQPHALVPYGCHMGVNGETEARLLEVSGDSPATDVRLQETEMSSVVPTVPKVKKSWPSPDTEDETEGEESPEGAASRGVTASGADTTVVDTAGSKTSRRWTKWPRGYALCIFSEGNCIRRVCKGILSFEVQIQGDSFKVFDNMILLCILVSCIGMAIDSPLADPKAPMTQVIRGANYLFTALFGAEMVIKLIALGLIWSEDAYLKNGWNILDGVVVITSVVDLTVDSGTGFLKGVRILRAFRPLRIISRNQNLRVVAQTIFASLQDLFSLMVVALLFLLIFALFACSFLSGRMYHCETEESILLLRDAGDFRTPLCLGAPSNPQSVALSSCPNGARDPNNTNAWVENGCSSCASDLHVSWSRAAVDTPICLGRCDPETTPDDVVERRPPEWLCPRMD
ncbi:unnamed protein product [Durusdinium trenchii]|uniref:Ion transport domain-containing protein n=1 Tax=Durusdinium trenchii TaxID=1381693 RepID=A0ABP0N2Z8_9DINO